MAPLYDPLLEQDAIRILSIKGWNQAEKIIECELNIVRLSETPQYAALSYTWHSPFQSWSDRDQANANGDEEDTYVLCNGRRLRVLPNVHAAMCRLISAKGFGREYWIDALCINQNDEDERSRQVDLMPEIFSQAKTVYVWLGPGSESLGDALDLIETLCEIGDERKLIHPFTLEDERTRSLLRNEYHKAKYWQALAQFFCRRWFTRAWVVQEFLLARALTVLCGDHVVSSSNLETVSDFLALSTWTKVFRETMVLQLDGARPYHNTPAKLRAAKLLVADPKDRNVLLYSLIRSHRFQCKDPRDKVFSVYGVARIASPPGTPIPKPDYAIGAGQAYHETAVSILRSSQDLLLLAYAEGERFRKETVQYPSWVPDWSIYDPIGLGQTGYARFAADASDRPRFMELRDDQRVLAIEGAIFDTVEEIGGSKREKDDQERLLSWLKLVLHLPQVYGTGESRLDVFWKTLITGVGPTEQDSECCESFKVWLAEACSREAVASCGPSGPIKRKLEELQDGVPWEINVESHRSLSARATATSVCKTEEDTRMSAFKTSTLAAKFDTLYSHAVCLRLFRTVNGLLGLGTESMHVGDEVCIASGSRVPLLIRRYATGTNRFELVGATYLHGVMMGEALGAFRPDFEVVELV